MKLFQHDAPVWRAIGTLGDMVLLNVLFVLTALPVVTVGGALTALADTLRRMSDGDDNPVHRIYLRSLRANLAQSTLLWAVVGTVGTGIAASWVFLRIPELLPLKALLTICYLLGFFFLWPLVARFDNTWRRHLRNAWLVAVSNLPVALAVLAIHAGFVALLVLVLIYAPQGLPLLLLLGVSLPWAATTPLLEKAFRPLLAPGR